jgi:AraC family transcriptional regulator of adaptative response/methylated-DNA-[protein]-cysteine methyltransferase
MVRRWPNAAFKADQVATEEAARQAFDPAAWQSGQPLQVVFIGSDFEVRVWETLLRIPMGAATTYSSIASHIGKPKAARAVGAAVGRNPISFVVPCHRVIGSTGALTGYHWGLTRKQAMLGWEAARAGTV